MELGIYTTNIFITKLARVRDGYASRALFPDRT